MNFLPLDLSLIPSTLFISRYFPQPERVKNLKHFQFQAFWIRNTQCVMCFYSMMLGSEMFSKKL